MMEASVARQEFDARALPARHWPIFVGFLTLATLTFFTLARQEWSRESGVHEPLVIVTAAWLIGRDLRNLRVTPKRGRTGFTAAIVFPSLFAYIFGRSFDYLIIETTGLYVLGIACVYDLFGGTVLKRLWFPFFYLLFALPVPGWLLDFTTAPLKELASGLTTNFLQLFGVPIAREGVTLFVAQYQLLVEDACAGMNAILGLTSLGLFYVYLLHGPSWKHLTAIGLCVIPIAVLSNVVRIIILVLITLWAGNDAAQGYLHGAAGLVTFATALLLLFLIDAVLSRHPIFRDRCA